MFLRGKPSLGQTISKHPAGGSQLDRSSRPQPRLLTRDQQHTNVLRIKTGLLHVITLYIVLHRTRLSSPATSHQRLLLAFSADGIHVDHVDVVVDPGDREGRPQVRPELRATEAVDEVDGGVEDDKISANKGSQPMIARCKVEDFFMKTIQNCWNSESNSIRK